MSTENDMSSLNFQDLVILKQFIEKGFRENMFNNHEKKGVSILHEKLGNTINHIITKANESNAKDSNT